MIYYDPMRDENITPFPIDMEIKINLSKVTKNSRGIRLYRIHRYTLTTKDKHSTFHNYKLCIADSGNGKEYTPMELTLSRAELK